MENKTIEKTMDLAGNAIKLAANLSEAKKEQQNPKPVPLTQTDDNSNNAQTGNQSVVVSVEKSRKKEPKPIEKHIHEFPENRPLTSEECELSLKKAQMDYELNKTRQEHLIRMDNLEWQHRLEQEKKNERKGKVKRIIGGILVALGVGTVGYSLYSDYRDHKNMPVSQPAPAALPAPEPVKAKGKVE